MALPSGPGPDALSNAALESEMLALNAHLNAGEYRFHELLAEMLRRENWAEAGILSPAHWLNYKCGIGAVAGREKVRVARALEALPLLREAFRKGEVSYSKVRAVTRVATPESEEYLLIICRHGTAAHVELLVRSHRKVEHDATRETFNHYGRSCEWWLDESGALNLRARLPAHEGQVVINALEAARFALAPAAGTGGMGHGEGSEGDSDQGLSEASDDAGGVGGASDPSTDRSPDPLVDVLDGMASNDGAPNDASTAGGHRRDASAETPEGDIAGGDRMHPPAPRGVGNGPAPIPSGSAPRERPDVSAETSGHGVAEPRVPQTHVGSDGTQSHDPAPEESPAPSLRPDLGETFAARRADALVLMAETLLSHGPAVRTGANRLEVVVHVDAGLLRAAHRPSTSSSLVGASDQPAPPGRPRPCNLDNGPALLPETARRLGCDATLVAVVENERGEVLNVGRRSRSVPPAIRRALDVRDGGCRFPGCTESRFVDAHHIVHWADGGETSLENLILLCKRHHRLHHEGGFTVDPDGTFRRADGAALPAVPSREDLLPGDLARLVSDHQRLGLVIDEHTGRCLWDGVPMDLAMAVEGILQAHGAL